MNVIHEIKLDLLHRGVAPRIAAVQSDSYSRVLALRLFAGKGPWAVPEDVQVLVRYRKSDRTGGCYDTLPDGSRAWELRSGALRITLAPQVLTCPGPVELAVTLIRGSARLTTFSLMIDVQRQPGFGTASENYSHVTAFLPQPAGGAQVGQRLQVSQVDSQGNVLALEAVSGGAGGGLAAADRELLLQLLRAAVYTDDVSAALEALEESWNEEEVVLTSVTAIYYGGQKPVGTALSDLVADMLVRANYSDGTYRVLTAEQYTLSGSDIAEGTNTCTVSYEGFSTSFTVTGYIPVYSVTYVLSNVSVASNIAAVTSGQSYHNGLSAQAGYVLSNVSVTMGGADVTADVYADGVVTISAVTGDVVITATAVSEEEENEVTLTSISADYTGGEVEAGINVIALKGLTVTAHYSDGTSETVTDYVLNGTIEEGENTVTVIYGGLTTTFTVIGTAPASAVYTVKNVMTNALSNNSLNIAMENSYYAATITANDGYELKTVTVTMGGVDVTADVYAGGIVEIDAVTGDIVITAVAEAVSYTLTHNWDFTSSLTDTVGGVTAELTGAAVPTMDSEGVHFTAQGNTIQLTHEDAVLCSKRVEIDIPSGLFEVPTAQHARLFGITPIAEPANVHGFGCCFVWRYNTSPGWTVYTKDTGPAVGGWGTSLDVDQYPITFFNGKTVRLDIDENGYLTLSCATIGEADFVTICTFEKHFASSSFAGHLCIGSSMNNDLFPATFSGVRIYEKGV